MVDLKKLSRQLSTSRSALSRDANGRIEVDQGRSSGQQSSSRAASNSITPTWGGGSGRSLPKENATGSSSYKAADGINTTTNLSGALEGMSTTTMLGRPPQEKSTPSTGQNIGSGFKSATTSSTSSGKTSAGILSSILDSDSPLMKRAATQGQQMANSRGLLNSSMAAGAAQGAMIDRASPLALQDSNNAYRENQFNAQQKNAFGQQYNDFVGRGQLADQGYQHQYGLNQQQFQNTGFLNDQQYLHDLGRASQGFDIQSALNDQGYIQNVGLIGAELGANQQMSAQDFYQQMGLNQQQGGIQQTLNQDEYNFRQNMSEQDFNEQLGVAAQDFGFQTELADQTFNNTMQELRASFSANAWGVMGNNIVNTVGDSAKMIDAIQLDPNISAEDKESLIADIQERTGNMVEIQQGLLGEFGGFLDNTGAFPDAPSGSSGNTPGGSDGEGESFGELDALASNANSSEDLRSAVSSIFSEYGANVDQSTINHLATQLYVGSSTESSIRQTAQQAASGGNNSDSGSNQGGNGSQGEAASNPEGQLNALYQDVFGRSPGSEARNHYLQKLNSGEMSLEQIRQEMMASDEYQSM